MERFPLKVRPSSPDSATLLVAWCEGGEGQTVVVRTSSTGFDDHHAGLAIIAAEIEWGGDANPLLAVLPAKIEHDLTDDPETCLLIKLIQSELKAARCGVDSVVNRLCEVLVVRMVRLQLKAGSAGSGVLSGLADPRISRAITAIHDHPGRNWSNGELSKIAGLSLSRFTELFAWTVGEPPSAYLRRWRLALARQDAAHGHRIETIARRYGYGSADGFARAFKKQYGDNPITFRHKPGSADPTSSRPSRRSGSTSASG